MDSQVIIGRDFIQAMIDLGVISVEDKVTRIVLDVRLDHPIAVYVDRIGDDRLLKVGRTLKGIEVSHDPGTQ